MSDEFVGGVILEWAGKEIECVSVSTETSTGKRIVKTMNRKKRAKGHASGIVDFKLSVEVPIPSDGTEPDWLSMTDAKITVSPIDATGKREVYTGCEVETISGKYQVEGHAVRSLSITALDMKMM